MISVHQYKLFRLLLIFYFILTYFLHIKSILDYFNGILFTKLVTSILSKKVFDSYWKKSDFNIMVVIFGFFYSYHQFQCY